MKRMFLPFVALCVLVISCTETPKQETPVASTVAEPAKMDVAQVKSEIVALEKSWADALNKKDIDALMGMFADNAVSMPDGEPMLVGKAAIRAAQEKRFKEMKENRTVSFETMDVYAQGDVVTETGKTFLTDAAGKTTQAGKYMAVFQKQDGKYLCIREIYNDDAKK